LSETKARTETDEPTTFPVASSQSLTQKHWHRVVSFVTKRSMFLALISTLPLRSSRSLQWLKANLFYNYNSSLRSDLDQPKRFLRHHYYYTAKLLFSLRIRSVQVQSLKITNSTSLHLLLRSLWVENPCSLWDFSVLILLLLLQNSPLCFFIFFYFWVYGLRYMNHGKCFFCITVSL